MSPIWVGGLENLLQEHAEEFLQHLLDKVAWIHLELDSGLVVDPEMPWKKSCLVIWEQFELEEVDKVIRTMSSATSFLDPCTS